MLNLHSHQKVPFGSKVNKNKNVCFKEKEHSDTKNTKFKTCNGVEGQLPAVIVRSLSDITK